MVVVISFMSWHKSLTVHVWSNVEVNWHLNFWRIILKANHVTFFPYLNFSLDLALLWSHDFGIHRSLIPGICLHFSTKDGWFVRKRSSVERCLVLKSTILARFRSLNISKKNHSLMLHVYWCPWMDLLAQSISSKLRSRMSPNAAELRDQAIVSMSEHIVSMYL